VSSSLQLVSITLRVHDLARSLAFYTQQVGFALVRQAGDRAELGVAQDGPVLLALLEDRAAPFPPADAAGLFHAALLFPERAALGAWLAAAAERGLAFDGFSDHGVSEAIYFTDPEGNGLEFYTDRPRNQWPFVDGQLAMTTVSLDVQSLVAAGRAYQGSPLSGARWGHLHLRVTELDRSEAFYRQTLGVSLTQGSYPGARFLAADGYHHHLGLNIWGHPHRAQPAGALGLVEAVFARPGEKSPRPLRDPDGIGVRLASA
jgi:catechol 2,3-dioxygenase